MKGLYTVEIIINPNGRPYVIDINGCDSGVGLFRAAHGDSRILERLLNEMERTGKRKTILSEHPPAMACEYNPKTEEVYKVHEKENDKLQRAAEKLGIDYIPFSHCKLRGKNTLEVIVGKKVRAYNPQDVGILWLDASEAVFREKNGFNEKLINPYIIEQVVDNKVYADHLLRTSRMVKYLPQTAINSPVVTPSKKFEDSAKYFVMKPNQGFAGSDVVHASAKMVKRVREVHKDEVEYESMRMLNQLKGDAQQAVWQSIEFYERKAFIVQQHIQSKLFYSKKIKKRRRSVIRVLLFEGKTIDVVHQFLGEQNYYTIEPMEHEERRKVSELAQKVTETLEERIKEEGISDTESLNQFKTRYWGALCKRTIKTKAS